MKKLGYFISVFLVLLYACSNSVNPVNNNNNNSNYKKIFETGNGDSRFELYSASYDTLRSGYNDIGFKVYQNSQEMTTGFVKFLPIMHHPPPITSYHSTPVCPQFNYDNDKKLFTGYASFIMVTDSFSNWYGFYNYNNSFYADSILFKVVINPYNQMKTFVDDSSSTSFWITLVSPLNPVQGLNDFKCLLHITQDDIYYTEVDSAQMSIYPWMNLMGHSSSGNIQPSYTGGGIYAGKVNLNMSGDWWVYDTIHYWNRVVSIVNSPPKFILTSP